LDESISTLIIAAVLTFFLAVVTGAISAVSSVRLSALEKLAEEKKDEKAGKALRFLKSDEDKIKSGLGAVYVLLALTIGVMVLLWAEKFRPGNGQTQLLIALAAIGVILAIAESLPRYLARINPEASMIFLYPAILIISVITIPISNVFSWLFSPLTSRLGKAQNSSPKITEEEIIRIVNEGEQLGVLEREEKEMIRSVIEFTDTIVREVMVPRVDIVGLDQDDTLANAINLMIESGFSRIPVYRESLDQIQGILYTKDILPLVKEGRLNARVIDMARKPPFFIPDTKPVKDLLKEMQKRSISIAIVVDEYGGTDGIVTIEDILEEIVGEITDEYDQELPAITRMAPGRWSVDGSTIIEDVNGALEIKVPSDEHETISGFVYGCLGHIPTMGEKLTLDDLGIDIEVEKIEGQRIHRLNVTKHPPAQDGEKGEG
jgi:CBS domain containing-hemolysin-like protein